MGKIITRLYAYDSSQEENNYRKRQKMQQAKRKECGKIGTYALQQI